MKTRILAIIIIGLLILGSCVKIPDNAQPRLPLSPVGSIPYDFDWKTIKTLDLTVNITPLGGSLNNNVHIIRVYSSPLLNSGSLIASGGAKINEPYKVRISVSTPTEELYIHETKPNGLVSVSTVKVSSAAINTTLTKSATGYENNNVFRANAIAHSVYADITIPTQFDVTINNNSGLSIVGFNTGESSAFGNTYKSYLIPSGFTRTGNINFGNSLQHAVLYVQGTLNLNSNAALNKTSIVVLSGGSVSVKGVSTGVIEADFPVLYIQNGGTFTPSAEVNISNSKFVNKGIVTTSKKIDINNNSEFHNEGTLNMTSNKKSDELHITNFAFGYNSGTITAPKISITTNGGMTNLPGGVITTKEWYQSNGSILNNHGEVAATEKFGNSGGGTVNNFCLITADETSMQQMTAVLESGSLWNSQKLSANNSTINMKGASMFLTGQITSIWAFHISSTSSTFSLFKSTGTVPAFTWANTTFNGNIEFVYTALTTANRSSYEPFLSNGAIINAAQTKNIPGTTCNGSLGQIEPDDDPGTTPSFYTYFPSQSGWATYAFEDLWPSKGDYDLNDLVLQFRVTSALNSSNQIIELIFDYRIVAVGATKQISAAFQLDNVSASAISSVIGQIAGGNSPFSIGSNGVESGVTKAIIPIFNHTTNVVSYSGFLNTIRDSYVSTSYNQVKVAFGSPVAQSTIGMDSFNFFIAVDERGTEVHLPGYMATEKFNSSATSGASLHPSDNFRSSDGMMWGLMFPSDFSYALEGKSIVTAYTHFAAWATSGGTQYTDWYLDLPGYRNYEFIY
ncbi:MAG: hypothetical protein CVU12_02510 [Bacteroidetes bacterium HGW-Bacteroidetes-7]|jgi:LruC domain-containing protein|nr:MAG: hypothetical protein CVU12_02510 [Bacteroidetes bacterium HGW-Bacteroidetes-7]